MARKQLVLKEGLPEQKACMSLQLRVHQQLLAPMCSSSGSS